MLKIRGDSPLFLIFSDRRRGFGSISHRECEGFRGKSYRRLVRGVRGEGHRSFESKRDRGCEGFRGKG